MSLSNDIANVISVHTQTLWFITEYVKEVGGSTKSRRMTVESLNVPKGIEAEFTQLAQKFYDHCVEKGEPKFTQSGTPGIVKLTLDFQFFGSCSKECANFFHANLRKLVLGIFADFYYPEFFCNMADLWICSFSIY